MVEDEVTLYGEGGGAMTNDEGRDRAPSSRGRFIPGTSIEIFYVRGVFYIIVPSLYITTLFLSTHPDVIIAVNESIAPLDCYYISLFHSVVMPLRT